MTIGKKRQTPYTPIEKTLEESENARNRKREMGKNLEGRGKKRRRRKNKIKNKINSVESSNWNALCVCYQPAG